MNAEKTIAHNVRRFMRIFENHLGEIDNETYELIRSDVEVIERLIPLKEYRIEKIVEPQEDGKTRLGIQLHPEDLEHSHKRRSEIVAKLRNLNKPHLKFLESFQPPWENQA